MDGLFPSISVSNSWSATTATGVCTNQTGETEKGLSASLGDDPALPAQGTSNFGVARTEMVGWLVQPMNIPNSRVFVLDVPVGVNLCIFIPTR